MGAVWTTLIGGLSVNVITCNRHLSVQIASVSLAGSQPEIIRKTMWRQERIGLGKIRFHARSHRINRKFLCVICIQTQKGNPVENIRSEVTSVWI